MVVKDTITKLGRDVQPAVTPLSRRVTVIMICVFGLAMTGTLFAIIWRTSVAEYRHSFSSDAAILSNAATNGLGTCLHDLEAVQRYLAVSDHVDQRSFQLFVKPMLERNGMQAVAWMPAETTPRPPHGQTTPPPTLSVLFAEPHQGDNNLFRLDLTTDRQQFDRITAAIRRGFPQADFLRLPSHQLCFQIIVPVYDVGGTFRGVVVGQAAVTEFLSSVRSHTRNSVLDAELNDLVLSRKEHVASQQVRPSTQTAQTISTHSLLFPVLEQNRPIEFAGRSWNLHLTATPEYLVNTASIRSIVIPPIGILLTIAFSVMCITLQARRELFARKAFETGTHRATAEGNREQYQVELSHAQEALQQANTLLAQEQQERKNIQEELLIKQIQLQSMNENLEQWIATEFEINRAKDAILLQQDKLASIGQLAAGVAHEVNNPIGFIMSNLNTFRSYSQTIISYVQAADEAVSHSCSPESINRLGELRESMSVPYVLEDMPELILESLDGAERVKQIVMDLMAFARPGNTGVMDTDINKCIQSTVNIVHNEIKYVADLVLELGDIPLISCNPQQINQVIANLLVNAAHSITGFGKITVTSRYEYESVIITVGDTGCGISQEIISKIFDPFFTTKDVGKGTGLGLSICFDIIKKHGGIISLESTPGSGTTFTITLPAKSYHDTGEENAPETKATGS